MPLSKITLSVPQEHAGELVADSKPKGSVKISPQPTCEQYEAIVRKKSPEADANLTAYLRQYQRDLQEGQISPKQGAAVTGLLAAYYLKDLRKIPLELLQIPLDGDSPVKACVKKELSLPDGGSLTLLVYRDVSPNGVESLVPLAVHDRSFLLFPTPSTPPPLEQIPWYDPVEGWQDPADFLLAEERCVVGRAILCVCEEGKGPSGKAKAVFTKIAEQLLDGNSIELPDNLKLPDKESFEVRLLSPSKDVFSERISVIQLPQRGSYTTSCFEFLEQVPNFDDLYFTPPVRIEGVQQGSDGKWDEQETGPALENVSYRPCSDFREGASKNRFVLCIVTVRCGDRHLTYWNYYFISELVLFTRMPYLSLFPNINVVS